MKPRVPGEQVVDRLAAHDDPCLPSAVNIHQRTVTDQAVARTFGLNFHPYVP